MLSQAHPVNINLSSNIFGKWVWFKINIFAQKYPTIDIKNKEKDPIEESGIQQSLLNRKSSTIHKLYNTVNQKGQRQKGKKPSELLRRQTGWMQMS